MRKGAVFVNDIYAGDLVEVSPEKYVFEYDEAYRISSSAKPVCRAMPLSLSRYESDYLFPFFSNLLCEGENRRFQSSVLKIDEKDDFGLLLATAGYETIGNVTIKPVMP